MPQELTIKKDNQLSPPEDYDFLRKEGIRLIEELSGNVWTDYNTHDPGITLLEALCYTLTDLGYRTAFDVKDLLAPEKGRLPEWEKSFFTARQILPCNPVTLNDYRKLIIDTAGVRNAWIEISDDYEILMYLQSQKKEAESATAYTLTYDAAKSDEVLRIRGLYKVFVEYEDSILASGKEKSVAKTIKDKLNLYRNLCEDFLSVTSIEYEYFNIEADIQVSEGTDIEKINARIYKVIHDFFSPPITFYTLEQMVEKGYSAEEIFEGPALQYGFINDKELESSERYKDIHLSDIMNLISGIEGVIAIKKLAVPLESQSPGSDFTQWVINLKEKQKAPRLDIDNSMVTFIRSGDRHRGNNVAQRRPDKGRVKAIFSFLQSAGSKSKLRGTTGADFRIVAGENMDVADYYPLQSMLPAAYGMAENYIDEKVDTVSIRIAINELLDKQQDASVDLSDQTKNLEDLAFREYGLPLTGLNKEEDISRIKNDYKRSQLERLDTRKRQTLQLRGFLMAFEQILSDYLSHLAHVKELFSFDAAVQQTYFPQPLQGIRNLQSLFIDYKKYQQSLIKMTEKEEDFVQRRDDFLNHLLGRFAESMDKYSYFLQSLSGTAAGKKLLEDKTAFLSDYVEISNYRGRGANYSDAGNTWDTLNVEGLKKRVCRLLGLPDYARKTIAPDAIFTETVTIDNSVVRHIAVLTDPAGKNTVLLRSVEFEFVGEAIDTLNYILENGNNRSLYEIDGRKDKWTYQLKRSTQENDEEIIATGVQYKSREEAEAAFEKTVGTLDSFSEKESFHLVEHILLRPRISPREKSTRKNTSLDTDTVSLLPIEDISDKEADIRRKELKPASYKFRITTAKNQGKKEKLLWRLSLMDKENDDVLIVEEDFLFYKHLTRRIEQIRQFASDNSNYKTSNNADGYFTYTINDGGRPLAVSKHRFRAQDEMDAEIANLIHFFSYEAGMITETSENLDEISYYADPYSFRISIFVPAWPQKFRNPTFRHLFEKSIYLETPSHISSQVYWLDHNQMKEFEEAYKVWVEEMANTDIPNTEIVNNFIEVLTKSRNQD